MIETSSSGPAQRLYVCWSANNVTTHQVTILLLGHLCVAIYLSTQLVSTVCIGFVTPETTHINVKMDKSSSFSHAREKVWLEVSGLGLGKKESLKDKKLSVLHEDQTTVIWLFVHVPLAVDSVFR